jgi:hypothetical protein
MECSRLVEAKVFEYSDHQKRAKQAASAIAAANILFQFNVGKGRIECCNEFLANPLGRP